jgi:conjugative transposon TraK protein
MENLIKQFNNIETSFRRMKFVTTLCMTAAVVIAVGSVMISGKLMQEGNDKIYVVDKGSAVMAARTDEDLYRDLEAKDHVSRFHELMFNISPSSESIKRNLDKALVMSDKSAYDYYMDLSERGFYQRMISANISQEIVVDSIKVNMTGYPYDAKTYGRLFLLRESNITAYSFESSCRLVDVERSQNNPHGLMIEKFTVTKNENLGTRKRK